MRPTQLDLSLATVIRADATALPLRDKSVDVTITSPPYCDARTYGINAQRGCVEWVMWMLDVVAECARVTIGPVIIVAAGVTRDRNYWPACEGLQWEWWKRGGECQLYRPVFWHRVGIPGSGGKDWFRSDVEYCMCFKPAGKLAWSDNTACGHPPKWGPGGEMSNRLSSGARVNQWGKNGSPRGMGNRNENGEPDNRVRPSHVTYFGNRPSVANKRANGVDQKATYFNGNQARRLERGNEKGGAASIPILANPGNVFKTNAGGGHLGHPLAHENEAPYPLALAEFFVKSLCPPDGTVFDPFCGSGTTLHAALLHGRRAIGCDVRQSQCDLTLRRLATPHSAKVKKAKGAKPEVGLFAEEVA